MDNKYYQDYMDNNAALYKALVKKMTEGGIITDNEFAFMVSYRQDIKQSMFVSPFKRIIAGVKEVINILNVDDTDKEEEE